MYNILEYSNLHKPTSHNAGYVKQAVPEQLQPIEHKQVVMCITGAKSDAKTGAQKELHIAPGEKRLSLSPLKNTGGGRFPAKFRGVLSFGYWASVSLSRATGPFPGNYLAFSKSPSDSVVLERWGGYVTTKIFSGRD